MKKLIKCAIFAALLGISILGCSNSIIDESSVQQNVENSCKQSNSQTSDNARWIWYGDDSNTGSGDITSGITSTISGGGN